MYEWNKFQTDEIRSCLGDVTASLWTLPIIHGSFQQVSYDYNCKLFFSYTFIFFTFREDSHSLVVLLILY